MKEVADMEASQRNIVCTVSNTMEATTEFMYARPISASCLFLTIFFLCVALRIYAQRSRTTTIHPKGYPLIGNLLEFMDMFNGSRTYDVIHEWADKLSPGGKTWQFTIPRFPGVGCGQIYFINDTEVLKHVLQTNFKNYVKGHNFRAIFEDFLGNGIFASDNAQWKIHRKIGSHMFSRKLLKLGITVALDHLSKLLKCLHLATRAEQVVDFKDLYYRLTINVFSKMAFGYDLQSIDPERIGGSQGGVQEHAPQHDFVTAFDCAQMASFNRMADPFWILMRTFPILSARETSMFKSLHTINTFSRSIIESRRQTVASGEQAVGDDHADERLDLISRFIRSAHDFSRDSGKSETPATDKELRDLVINFMIAGRDTTAAGLSWLTYELLNNDPKIVQRIIDEADEVIGKPDLERPALVPNVILSQVGKLTYLHACAMESLRLHPSVHIELKYSVGKDLLPDSTKIPANSAIVYPIYSLCRNKTIWGPDAEKFVPERWLFSSTTEHEFVGTSWISPKLVQEPSVLKYPVFNVNPRLCLGKGLAFLEMKLTTALILQRFSLSQRQGEEHDGTYIPTLVAAPSGELLVKPMLRMK